MGKTLVVWPPKESIREHLPELFFKPGYGKRRVIIDCVEVLLKDRILYHNTFKILIGIIRIGFILFLSSCYGGRANDKFITKDSGFYDLLERDDEVMADRGF